jgi:hypothetical protein
MPEIYINCSFGLDNKRITGAVTGKVSNFVTVVAFQILLLSTLRAGAGNMALLLAVTALDIPLTLALSTIPSDVALLSTVVALNPLV